MERVGFDRFVVCSRFRSEKVVAANTRRRGPAHVPLHPRGHEAACRPRASSKSRLAFEKLLAAGIGDTLRVSLTLPNERKHEEVEVGHKIIQDVEAGRSSRFPDFAKAEHHLVPELLARRERELGRVGAAGGELAAYAATHGSRSPSWLR